MRNQSLIKQQVVEMTKRFWKDEEEEEGLTRFSRVFEDISKTSTFYRQAGVRSRRNWTFLILFFCGFLSCRRRFVDRPPIENGFIAKEKRGRVLVKPGARALEPADKNWDRRYFARARFPYHSILRTHKVGRFSQRKRFFSSDHLALSVWRVSQLWWRGAGLYLHDYLAATFCFVHILNESVKVLVIAKWIK